MAKSFKIWVGAIGKESVLSALFGNRDETVKVAELLIWRMKEGDRLSISRRQMRVFAEEIAAGKLGVRYSYHNFYTKLLRKLLILGLVEKSMMWSPKRRTTVWAYRLVPQSISQRPPPTGFYRLLWQVAKEWNELIEEKQQSKLISTSTMKPI